MAWRIVKQPNGGYARFSEVVDDFTHYNMDRAEALDLCQEYMGRQDAKTKVQAADDHPERWEEALQIIKRIHGHSVIFGET